MAVSSATKKAAAGRAAEKAGRNNRSKTRSAG
jgi:hypothetical protein